MQKKHIYIIIGSIAVLLFLQTRLIFFPKPAEQVPPSQNPPQPIVENLQEPSYPSIEDIKNRIGPDLNKPEEKPAFLPQVYTQYPKEDTGNNIVKSWEKVRPEEKAKVEEELDKQIEQAKEVLQVNPEDKRAKHALFISETMKKLCKTNFNYVLLESVPEEEGGLKKKGK